MLDGILSHYILNVDIYMEWVDLLNRVRFRIWTAVQIRTEMGQLTKEDKFKRPFSAYVFQHDMIKIAPRTHRHPARVRVGECD